MYQRYAYWCEKGHFERLFQGVQQPDLEEVMLDSTCCRALPKPRQAREKQAARRHDLQQTAKPGQRKISTMNHHHLNGFAALGLASLFIHHTVFAAPLLQCHVAYAGTTHVIEAEPVADPYRVPSVDIGGRFRFKAVMVGSAAQIDRILLYAYLDTSSQPVLIQQVKYLPPFKASATPYPLTGEQHLYAGPAERELIYSCSLKGIAP